MAQVLFVEDDEHVRVAVGRSLQRLGHEVTTSPTALDGLRVLVAQQPEVVVLDLGLPDLDGVALLRMIRPISNAIVIAATARVAEADIIATLDAGADDYCTKPFSPEQLDARIRAALRRVGPRDADPEIVIGELRINRSSRVASLSGRELDLSRKEFDLLHFLAVHRGRVVSKRELLTEVWRQPVFTTDKTVDVHVSWLRRKLGETADQPRFLRSIRGVGIKLDGPDV